MSLPGCLRRPPHLHLLPTWQSRQGALPRVPRRTGRPPHPASNAPLVLRSHPVTPMMLVGPASRGPYGQDIDLSIPNFPNFFDAAYKHHVD